MRNTIFIVLFSVILVSGSVVPATFADHVSAGSGVETLGKFNEKIIAVKQGNILATSFHPELTRDVSLHKHFVQKVKESI